MAGLYRCAMDALYLTALVLISAVIPWAVFTRYVLNSAASWPEPMAVLLTILLTFIGAAAGYRLNLHMNLAYFANQTPPPVRRALDILLSVGVTYLPIPVGGCCLLLFIIERLFIGAPPAPIPHHDTESFE